MKTQTLPEWAENMTPTEWATKCKTAKAYTNCATCDQRLIMTLCKYDEPKYYCEVHCPEHKWQSNYDWRTECARCGIPYTAYLESLLKKHKIPFKRAR